MQTLHTSKYARRQRLANGLRNGRQRQRTDNGACAVSTVILRYYCSPQNGHVNAISAPVKDAREGYCLIKIHVIKERLTQPFPTSPVGSHTRFGGHRCEPRPTGSLHKPANSYWIHPCQPQCGSRIMSGSRKHRPWYPTISLYLSLVSLYSIVNLSRPEVALWIPWACVSAGWGSSAVGFRLRPGRRK